MVVSVIYDALIIGGGPAGMATALGLARVCRTSVLFDSGEYRNQGAKDMHNVLHSDSVPPEEYRATCLRQLEKYKDQIYLTRGKITQVVHTDIVPGLKGFKAIDSAQKEFLGRKLVLATGTEDVLPTEIEGYKENWPTHM